MSKIYSIKEAHREVSPGVRTLTALVGKRTGNEKVAAIIVEYEPGVEPGGIHHHEMRESAYIALEGSAGATLEGNHIDGNTAQGAGGGVAPRKSGTPSPV